MRAAARTAATLTPSIPSSRAAERHTAGPPSPPLGNLAACPAVGAAAYTWRAGQAGTGLVTAPMLPAAAPHPSWLQRAYAALLLLLGELLLLTALPLRPCTSSHNSCLGRCCCFCCCCCTLLSGCCCGCCCCCSCCGSCFNCCFCAIICWGRAAHGFGG
jgi:hypothetical protein